MCICESSNENLVLFDMPFIVLKSKVLRFE